MAEAVAGRGRHGRGVPVIASRFREARQEAGLTLSQVGGDLVTRAFVHQIENGQARPSLCVLRAIASRLGQSVDYFIDESVAAGDPKIEFSIELDRIACDMETTIPQLPDDLYRAMVLRVTLVLRNASAALRMAKRDSQLDTSPFTGETEPSSVSLNSNPT